MLTTHTEEKIEQHKNNSNGEFENYKLISDAYDQTRVPVGTAFILNTLKSSDRPLSQQSVLDAGCGTGNYLNALQGKIGRLYGVEANEGMLLQVRRKFETVDNITIKQGSICDIPYEAERFDGVICNQVLHHLDEPSHETNAASFPNVNTFIQEAYRVLRPYGSLIINISSHRQVRQGYWYLMLIPQAVNELIKQLPSIELLISMCLAAGFKEVHQQIETQEVLQGKSYYDFQGPLKAEWRDGDSTWALATESEKQEALKVVQEMNQNKSIHKFIAGAEVLREHIGQSTFVVATKPHP